MSTQRKVLCIENRHIAPIICQRVFHSKRNIVDEITARIREHGEFVDRDWAENNVSVKQVVACGVIRHKRRVLCLRRAARSSRRELRLNWTLMIGGHVDELDVGVDDPILNCVTREVKEEVGLEPEAPPRILGYVTDPATSVGRLHIGAIFLFESAREVIYNSKRLDSYEFVNSDRKRAISFCDPEFVVDLSRSGNLDPWSDIFAKANCDISRNLFREFSYQQLELPFRWR